MKKLVFLFIFISSLVLVSCSDSKGFSESNETNKESYAAKVIALANKYEKARQSGDLSEMELIQKQAVIQFERINRLSDKEFNSYEDELYHEYEKDVDLYDRVANLKNVVNFYDPRSSQKPLTETARAQTEQPAEAQPAIVENTFSTNGGEEIGEDHVEAFFNNTPTPQPKRQETATESYGVYEYDVAFDKAMDALDRIVEPVEKAKAAAPAAMEADYSAAAAAAAAMDAMRAAAELETYGSSMDFDW